MQIIGLQDDSTYLAIVSHTELEKSANLYYGNMKRLKVGDVMDVGQGYNFTNEIQRACKEMSDAMKAFETAKETMMKFAVMVAELEQRQ